LACVGAHSSADANDKTPQNLGFAATGRMRETRFPISGLIARADPFVMRVLNGGKLNMYQDRLLGPCDLTILNNPSSLVIQIEPRKARLTDAITPAEVNSWCYVNVPAPRPIGEKVLTSYLGPVINVQRGCPLTIVWNNKLSGMGAMGADGPSQVMPPINPIPMDFPSWMWRAMNPSVGIVPHLHGAKAEHTSDGWPLEPVGYVGNTSTYGFPTSRSYRYPNDQRASMLWFHDHGMDNTAVQVHAGLAGLYFIRDKSDEDIFKLIGGAGREIPLVIQDRMVDCGFESFDYWAGAPTSLSTDPKTNETVGDFIRPEFLGETIFVNGRPSPFVEVERGVYRLRVLNGSNARTYALALIDPCAWSPAKTADAGPVWRSDLITIIGADGGLLSKSHKLGAKDYVLISPSERLDLLLDLTSVDPDLVGRLRLVNLALNSLRNDPFPEAIFQTEEEIVYKEADADAPGSPKISAQSSVLPVGDEQSLPAFLGVSQANILQFCLGCEKSAKPLDPAKLDAILAKYASDEGFKWNGTALEAIPADAPIARNRFVLLMNDTTGLAPDSCPMTKDNWRDTQMWELTTIPGQMDPFKVPFEVETEASNPASGAPTTASGAIDYYVARSSFFDHFPPSRLIDRAPDHKYADLHAPTFKPTADAYERWYVANLGNAQSIHAIEPDGTIPDMHPFHIHLVNFVVTKRWRLDAKTNLFVETTGSRPLDFDLVARRDTVRVQANELLELLVYFPEGYKGIYPYHCHVVEHEDMGMMLHFEVV
jgi:FtsP/CotA-like multicopper oxidase with cupredoxin domain